jgi:hypothetical protein
VPRVSEIQRMDRSKLPVAERRQLDKELGELDGFIQAYVAHVVVLRVGGRNSSHGQLEVPSMPPRGKSRRS